MKNFIEDSFSTLNSLWAILIIEELFRCGVEHFCICSGSRSTPLTLAAAAHLGVKTTVHFDERGMAYYALGYAKADRSRLAAVITTSGTAVSNLFPATVEAFQSSLPLLLLTADRPPELLDTGANQTIDQSKIFTGYLRWHASLPCPDLRIEPSTLLTTVDQAVYKCRERPGGPVHLNCMFREPFLSEERCTYVDYLSPIQHWSATRTPFTSYLKSQSMLPLEDCVRFAQKKINLKKGIIITGALQSLEESEEVLSLAKVLNWPIFADISSHMRMFKDPRLITYYDLMLFNPNVQSMLRNAQCFLQFGVHLTSKRLLMFLAKNRNQDLILVADTPARHDPSHRVSMRIESNISHFCQSLLEFISPLKEDTVPIWWHPLKTNSKQMEMEMDGYFSKDAQLTEPSVACFISECVPRGSQLFLGNSMPIRLMDMFATTRSFLTEVRANRGASGIDGVVASAAGYATAGRKPTTLLIGDLSLLHDMNSLYLVRKTKNPLVIVVLNNNGGGIFSMLPIAQQKEFYEKYFRTPHHLDFKELARFFKIAYEAPLTIHALRKAYLSAIVKNQTTLIEVQTDFTQTNRVIHFFNEKLKQQVFEG